MKEKDLRKKEKGLTLVIFLSGFIAVAAIIFCIIGIFLKIFYEDTSTLDYVLAIVGFVGAVTGVSIPLFWSQKSNISGVREEMNSLIESVYDELADYYSSLQKFDTFKCETPAWECFKANYIHFVGIDKKISEGISSVYNNISILNDLFTKYNDVKDSNSKEKLQVVTEINELRTAVINAISNIIFPTEVLVCFDEDNKTFIAKKVGAGNKSSNDIVDSFNHYFDTSLKGLVNKKEIDLISNQDYLDTMSSIFSRDLNNYYKKEHYRITKMCTKDDRILFLTYVVPFEIFDMTVSNEKVISSSNIYSNYLDSLPSLLMMDYISPTLYETNIKMHNYFDTAKCIAINIFNSNLCYFVIKKCLENDCLKEVVETLIHIINPVIVISFFNKITMYCKAGGGPYNEQLDIKINSILSKIEINQFEDSLKKDTAEFIVKYCSSFADGKMYEYKCRGNHIHALLFNTRYMDLCFTNRFYKRLQQGLSKEQMIELLITHRKNIESCKNAYSFGKDYLDKKDVHYQRRNVMFTLLNRIPDIYNKLIEVGYEDPKENYSETIFNSANSSIEDIFSIENYEPWDYTALYEVAFTTTFIFSSNYISEKIIKETSFYRTTNFLLDTIETHKNTILEEIYASIYIKWIAQAYFGLIKAIRTSKTKKELENLKIIQATLEMYWNANYSKIRAVSAKVSANGEVATELDFQLDVYNRQYETYKNEFLRKLQEFDK